MSLHTLMFGWEYPPKHSGGLGVACQGLVRGLLHHGVHVTLVLPSSEAEGEHNLDVRSPADDVHRTLHVQSGLQPYDSFDSYRLRMIQSGTDDMDLYGPDMGGAVEQFTAMAVDMTKDIDPDVVHCHDWMTYEAGIRASRYHRRPLVAHIHATELDRTDFHPNEWIVARERKGLLHADRVIAVSNYTKDILHKHYGIANDKIIVVHNGHEQQTMKVKPTLIAQRGSKKAPLVLFLGRLTVQKNPIQFLDVARTIHALRPDVQFVMAGDGPMMGHLIESACDRGLEECMTFTGKVSSREAQALYSAADCFVMPSLSEPFGLVALEAIAHGAPVIVSKQSGAAEVIDHAFKVDFWDTDLMADCILTILREEPLAMQLKAEAPRLLQKLTWRNQAKEVQSIYTHIIHS
jgi:glycosyltransferase involved in cell wall biosynthesis